MESHVADNSPRETKDIVSLLFVGSPLLDISGKCEEDALRRFGLNEDDCVIAREEHDLLFQQLFHSPESRLAAGGSAQNAARIAKWILGAKGDVAFAGCAGNDDFESWMKIKLVSEGVVPLYVNDPVANTGVCACLLTPKGDRSMCARQGAAALFSTQHLNTELIQSHVQKADCIFIEGYFVVHSPAVVLDLAEHHSRKQVLAEYPDADRISGCQVFSLSLSAEYVCRSHADALMKVIPKVDVLLGNEGEVKAFARAKGADENVTVEEAAEVIRQLQTSSSHDPRILLVTRGSKPVILFDGSDNHKVFHVPEGVPVVDSVGCGDALAGAFLASYVLTRNVDSAVRTGIHAALQILQVPGCDPPLHQGT